MLEELFWQNPNLERLLRPDESEMEGLSDNIDLLRVARDEEPECSEHIFQLAAALISHSRTSYIEEGVQLMEALVYDRWQANWSEVVSRSSLLPPRDVPAIARGVTVTCATAPPLSDEDVSGESLVARRRDARAEDEARRPSADPAPPAGASSECDDIADSGVSEGRTEVSQCRAPDADPSKTRPGSDEELGHYHYYLAIGWIKLKQMEKAAACVKQMLHILPDNKQGRAVQRYIEVAGRKSTAADAATVASVGVVLAGVAALAGALLRGKQSSS